jgi:putative resolvase
MKYVPSREAAKVLGVHPNSLRSWANQGKIQVKLTPGGKRLYDIESFIGIVHATQSICYCRVSSIKQRDDLERQVAYMRERYPTYEVITDIASGLNFKRKGLRSLLERVLRREVCDIVVAYKDRLARFGFDLLKWLVESHGGKIVVLNDVSMSPADELTQDLLAIITIFSCRMHGLRKYRQTLAEDSTLSDSGAAASPASVDGDGTVCL